MNCMCISAAWAIPLLFASDKVILWLKRGVQRRGEFCKMTANCIFNLEPHLEV